MKGKNVQELAEQLGLSRVTIWKVLNNKPGVSPQTVKRVLELVNNIQVMDEQRQRKNITLVATQTNISVFWSRIVDQIAWLLNRSDISMSYYPIAAMGMSSVTLDSALRQGKTDGLIVLNVYDKEILWNLSQKGLPTVYLDSVPGFSANTLCGDLLRLEGKQTVCAITERLISAGNRTIGFVGEINDAISNLDRFKGYKRAMENRVGGNNPKFCLTSLPDPDSYREVIQGFLNSLPFLPDAFVCVNDYIAFLMRSLLVDRADRIPILTGYDNSTEFMLDHYGITTVDVQNDMIGKRMVRQILFRIENPDADPEEITIFPKIIFR